MSIILFNILMGEIDNDSRVKKCIMAASKKFEVKAYCFSKRDHTTSTTVSDSVNIIRLSVRPLWIKIGLIRHLYAYLLFNCKVLKDAVIKPPQVVHVNDLKALSLGVLLKFLTGSRLVYDCHEHETEDLKLVGRPVQKKLCKILEKNLIKFTDSVVTVSPEIAIDYENSYNIRTELVLNAPPRVQSIQTETPNITVRNSLGLGDDVKIVLYLGGLVRGRGIECLLSTISMLPQNVHICFVGYGELEELIKNSSDLNPRIHFHRAVEPSQVVSFVKSADVGISIIPNTCRSYDFCLPNKLFEYIHAGLPIVCSNLVSMRRFITKYRVGEIVDELSPENVASKILKVLSNKNDYLKQMKDVQNEYCWERQEETLLGIYSKILEKSNKKFKLDN
jgi:glycosyltransferase involved in cell wall biosynthesis